MSRIALSIGVALALLTGIPAVSAAQACLHRGNETAAERQRRLDALTAVKSINFAEHSAKRAGSYRPLDELSPFLAAHRSDGGRLGEVARRMRFDRSEILPGWEAHLLFDADSYIVTLKDLTDPCGFTYTTDQNDVIVQGHPIPRVEPFSATGLED